MPTRTPATVSRDEPVMTMVFPPATGPLVDAFFVETAAAEDAVQAPLRIR